MFCNNRFLGTRFRVLLSVFFLALFLTLITGCSPIASIKKTAKKFSRNLKSSDGNLKRKIGIVPFANRTIFADSGHEKTLEKHFIEAIKAECPGMIIIKPGETLYTDSLVKLPRLPSGRIDNITLAETGRRSSLNAIVTGGLISIVPKQEKRGILWFKDTSYSLQIEMNVEVYDTETGAKLLDESFAHDIEVDETNFELINLKKEIRIPELIDLITDTASDMGEMVCDAVKSQPWKGYVLSVIEDKIIISSGRTAGLVPETIFDVYDSAKIIKGADGQRFFIPGNKAGKLKITAVYPDRAEAVSISDMDIKEGSLIRPQ